VEIIVASSIAMRSRMPVRKVATLLRFPQADMEHQRRRWVRELVGRKRVPHWGLAQIRRGAFGPSATSSAAERAIAANSQSKPPSRADKFHAPRTGFENQLVMSFRDPKDFVDGLEPIPQQSYAFDAWPSGLAK